MISITLFDNIFTYSVDLNALQQSPLRYGSYSRDYNIMALKIEDFLDFGKICGLSVPMNLVGVGNDYFGYSQSHNVGQGNIPHVDTWDISNITDANSRYLVSTGVFAKFKNNIPAFCKFIVGKKLSNLMISKGILSNSINCTVESNIFNNYESGNDFIDIVKSAQSLKMTFNIPDRDTTITLPIPTSAIPKIRDCDFETDYKSFLLASYKASINSHRKIIMEQCESLKVKTESVLKGAEDKMFMEGFNFRDNVAKEGWKIKEYANGKKYFVLEKPIHAKYVVDGTGTLHKIPDELVGEFYLKRLRIPFGKTIQSGDGTGFYPHRTPTNSENTWARMCMGSMVNLPISKITSVISFFETINYTSMYGGLASAYVDVLYDKNDTYRMLNASNERDAKFLKYRGVFKDKTNKTGELFASTGSLVI